MLQGSQISGSPLGAGASQLDGRGDEAKKKEKMRLVEGGGDFEEVPSGILISRRVGRRRGEKSHLHKRARSIGIKAGPK